MPEDYRLRLQHYTRLFDEWCAANPEKLEMQQISSITYGPRGWIAMPSMTQLHEADRWIEEHMPKR